MQIVQKIMIPIFMFSTLHAGANLIPLPAKQKVMPTKAIMPKSKEVMPNPNPNENSEALAYEDALNSAVSHYVADLQAADKDEAKIMAAMEKYHAQLISIDQKYQAQAKAEAEKHLQKITEQKAKWHEYDLAYQHLKTEFAKELDPYWKAQQEIWEASWNKNMEHNVKLREMANKISQAASHSLQIQYSDALTKFHTAMQKLSRQNSY